MDMKSDDGNINKISCHHKHIGNPLNDKSNEYCIVYVDEYWTGHKTQQTNHWYNGNRTLRCIIDMYPTDRYRGSGEREEERDKRKREEWEDKRVIKTGKKRLAKIELNKRKFVGEEER